MEVGGLNACGFGAICEGDRVNGVDVEDVVAWCPGDGA